MKLFIKTILLFLYWVDVQLMLRIRRQKILFLYIKKFLLTKKIIHVDGAIYNEKSSGFFASDRRAKNIGDILTITLNESLSASKSTTNTTSKADTFGVTLPPLFSNGAATQSAANQLDNKLGIGNGGVDSTDFTAGANQVIFRSWNSCTI